MATIEGTAGNDTLKGGSGNDYILGRDGDDQLYGNQGSDRLQGGSGNDRLKGGTGNDQLKGKAGADSLKGGDGRDRLLGGSGRDILTGGEGRDRFVLSSSISNTTLATADVITDLEGEDWLELAKGINLSSLKVAQGKGDKVADTIITDKLTGQFLAILPGIERSTITKANFLTGGTLEFSAANFSVREDDTPIAAVTVTRSGRSDSTASAKITLSEGSATLADYRQKPVSVKFAKGEVEQTIQIPLIDDQLIEGPETIQLSLEAPSSGAAIGEQKTATLEIVDNDPFDRYAITDIGMVGEYGSVTDINNAGQVVGHSDPPGEDTNAQAFIWEKSTGKQELGTLGGDSSEANAINNEGQVTGVAETSSGRNRAFLWSKNTGMKNLGVPKGENPAAFDTTGVGINDQGQVVGNSLTIYFDESGQQVYEASADPFIWENNTGFTTIDFPSSDYKYDNVRDINNSGQVAGSSSDQYGAQAYRWSKNGGATKLAGLTNQDYTSARGINDLGQVVGDSYDGSETTAVLWDDDGTIQDLDPLEGDSSANDINKLGQVVGYSEIADQMYQPFLYQGGTRQNLNSLIPANSGWKLESANAINDLGQIVGTGTIDGQTHAFLATPI
ncbi:Alkaline phosphatase [uncultured Synechococcales cyanobacterium]|uniref:Alkaline phosphatase n=1 Tax=uncultured Synechococcales cyanobacterium TaxID=1936017 RepID=A0A6J4VL28_9CYAN|nr:Alkaline phosphatase [uncultured Synechococcales cyanobacterium]